MRRPKVRMMREPPAQAPAAIAAATAMVIHSGTWKVCWQPTVTRASTMTPMVFCASLQFESSASLVGTGAAAWTGAVTNGGRHRGYLAVECRLRGEPSAAVASIPAFRRGVEATVGTPTVGRATTTGSVA
jgi:hypothetical protein